MRWTEQTILGKFVQQNRQRFVKPRPKLCNSGQISPSSADFRALTFLCGEDIGPNVLIALRFLNSYYFLVDSCFYQRWTVMQLNLAGLPVAWMRQSHRSSAACGILSPNLRAAGSGGRLNGFSLDHPFEAAPESFKDKPTVNGVGPQACTVCPKWGRPMITPASPEYAIHGSWCNVRLNFQPLDLRSKDSWVAAPRLLVPVARWISWGTISFMSYGFFPSGGQMPQSSDVRWDSPHGWPRAYDIQISFRNAAPGTLNGFCVLSNKEQGELISAACSMINTRKSIGVKTKLWSIWPRARYREYRVLSTLK